MNPTALKSKLDSEASELGIEKNADGLAVLPDELLLEIISHFYFPPIDTDDGSFYQPELYTTYREALLALSRTCSSLRRFCRPYIWERIEVSCGRRVGSVRLSDGMKAKDCRTYAVELIRQLKTVSVLDPSLIEYVNIVNLDILECSMLSTLEELARCMALFVNLHTVRLQIWGDSEAYQKADTAFRPYTYPQIRSAVISKNARPLVSQCPGLRSLHCSTTGYTAASLLLETAINSCPLLESIPWVYKTRRAVKAFHNLRDLTLQLSYDFPDQNIFAEISALTRLRKITLIYNPQYPPDFPLDDILVGAREFLVGLQKRDKELKLLRLIRSDCSGTSLSVTCLAAPDSLSNQDD